MAVALVLLLVVFAGLARHTLAMTLGRPGRSRAETAHDTVHSDTVHVDGALHGAHPHGGRHGYPDGPTAPLVLALGVVGLLGLAVLPLREVLTSAATLLIGGTP